MVRKRKSGPRKATVPLSQIAAQLQEEKSAAGSDGPAVARSAGDGGFGAAASARPVVGAADASPSATTENAASEAPASKPTAPETAEAEPSANASTASTFSAVDGGEPGDAAQSGSVVDAASDGGDSASSAQEADSEDSDNADASQGTPASEADGPTPFDDADAAEGEAESDFEAPESARPSKRKSVRRVQKPKRLGLWIAIAVVVLIAVAASLFAWDRWARYDDAADFQGEWHVADSANTVTIDGESIHLTDKEAYAYTMDAGVKTLTFTFGDLSGQARYRFSADRTQVAIQDGEFGAMDTLASDIAWAWSCLIGTITGQSSASPSLGEGSLVLTREPSLPAEQPAEDAEGAAGSAEPGEQQDASDESPAEDQPAEEPSSDDQEAEQQAAEEQAAAEAAEEEKRQEELHIQEALTQSGESGSVGSNALAPEDLM